jgi:hypothetical protein
VCWGTGLTSKISLFLYPILTLRHATQRLTEGTIDRDYDIHGPAGPTAFWKENDDLEETMLSMSSRLATYLAFWSLRS